MSRPRLFALPGTRRLGEAVASSLGVEAARYEERRFDDGEHATRPMEDVRGVDAYVVHSLHAEPDRCVDEKLNQVLFFSAALRDAGAARVTVVAPYLCYARQERRKHRGDPVTTRYVAALMEAAGVDRVATVDVHDVAAFENAFRLPTEHLEARPLLLTRLAPSLGDAPVTVLSPDLGGAKRADAFRRALAQALTADVALGFVEKRRDGQLVTGDVVGPPVEGRRVVLVDDVIATGATLALAARACRRGGARSVHAVATHGLFAGGAPGLFDEGGPDGLVITNTAETAPVPVAAAARVAVVDVTPLLADAIRRLHEDRAAVGHD